VPDELPSLKSQRSTHSWQATFVTVLFLFVAQAPAQTKAVGDPPSIDEQPIGRVVSEGGYATLLVVAHGTEPLSYHWMRNGMELPTDPHITGNTGAVLNIDPLLTNDTAFYQVIIANSAGTNVSSLAQIQVNPIALGLSVQGGTGLLAHVFSQRAEVCRIESANSTTGPWVTNAYATNFFGTPPAVFLRFAGLGNFLRVRFDHLLPTLYPSGVGVVRAYGKLNEAWRFDASGDLEHWASLFTVTNSTGWMTLGDPRDFLPVKQFYRLAPP
jgi:hypothetical protein